MWTAISALSRAHGWIEQLRHGDRLDADLDQELADWIDELSARYVAQGLPAKDARRRALIESGGIQRVKESVREVRGGAALEALWSDVRFAWSGLYSSPILTAVIVGTIALGIGANTAIFSIVKTALIAPLPYRDSSQLVMVWSDMSSTGYSHAPLSGPELSDLRRRSTLFSGWGGVWSYMASLNMDGRPEQVRLGVVTPDFFSMLGAEAAIGRTFRDDDAAAPGSLAVVLTHALWQRRYRGDSSIVGRQILLEGRPATVIGIMPSGFRVLMPPDEGVPDEVQAWGPLWPAAMTGPRRQKFLRVIGRMREGVSLERARAEVAAISSRISQEFAEYGGQGPVFRLASLGQERNRNIRSALVALFAGVSTLLAIVAVNVASLLMARAGFRRKEIAITMAIGASRRRVFRRCLLEGITVSMLGAAAGVVIGRSALAVLIAVRPENLPSIARARIDPTVLAFTAIVSICASLLFSFAPLWEVSRVDLGSVPFEGEHSSSRGRARGGIILVVGQLALTVVLLVCAGLLTRTFVVLAGVDPGFRSQGVLSFRITLPVSRYPTPEAVDAVTRTLHARISALPLVRRAGAISHVPYDDLPNWGGTYLAGPGAAAPTPLADVRAVSPGFFEIVGARLTEGRCFTDADDPDGPPVVIVDDRLARRTWPGSRAAGRELIVDPYSIGRPTRRVTVVGVVQHLEYRDPMLDVREQIYFPIRQIPQHQLAYVFRGSAEPSAVAAQLRQAVGEIDKDLAVSDVRPFSDYTIDARATQRFTAALAAIFAAVAMLLACVGTYGVTAYLIACRHRELSVRLALGARQSQVVGLVMREGLQLAFIGLSLGIIGAMGAATLLRPQLYGVTPFDFVSYVSSVAGLGAAVIGACWLPTRRFAAGSAVQSL